MSVFDRLFGKRPTDPADRLINWLADKNLDERRIIAGILYGGPYSLKVWRWILSRPECDVGTASMMLWHMGRPDIALRREDRFPLNDQTKEELINFVADRWRRGLFAGVVFEWDNREQAKLYRRELKKKGLQGRDPFAIPDDAWQPIKGRAPVQSAAVNYHSNKELADTLHNLRLADLAETDPATWEPIRRRSLGLD